MPWNQFCWGLAISLPKDIRGHIVTAISQCRHHNFPFNRITSQSWLRNSGVIREARVSMLEPAAARPVWGFSWFPSVCQANAGMVPIFLKEMAMTTSSFPSFWRSTLSYYLQHSLSYNMLHNVVPIQEEYRLHTSSWNSSMMIQIRREPNCLAAISCLSDLELKSGSYQKILVR